MTDTPKSTSKRSFTVPFPLSSSLKKKLAPRSSLQFKIGPEFSTTSVQNAIFDSKGCKVSPIITPRIDRGFEMIEGEWVGYKRNYFTLVSSFYFENTSFLKFAAEKYYIFDPETNEQTRIEYFGLKLSSNCADDGGNVVLVQHTAKRDRGPQFEPPTHPAVPGDLPNHTIIREAANVRNTSKIAKLNRVFFFDKEDHDDSNMNISGLRRYPDNKIIKVVRYERIQFSSSINYKKPSLNNKRFKLCVELVGKIKDSFVTLALTETPPLIVRGRSPSNYQGSESEKFDSELSSCPHSTPIDNLDDFATYNILKLATEDLEMSPSFEAHPKKKRGRKPKLQNVGSSSKKQKIQKTSTEKKKPKKSAIGKAPPVDSENQEQSFNSHNSPFMFQNEQGLGILDSKASRTLDFNDVTKMASPVIHLKEDFSEDNILNYNIDDSAQLVDLFDSQMQYSINDKLSFEPHRLSYSKDFDNFANIPLVNYDSDLIQLRGHIKCENEKELSFDDLTKMTNPSEVLHVGDFDDGPSFISYA